MSVFRYAAVVLAVGSLAGVIYAVASGAGQSSVTAQRFVNLQEGAKPHEGFRRAHAKGFCVAGEFLSNGKLAPYSTAQVFQPGKTGFVGRMSIAGTNPTAPDLRSPVRSLALNLGQGDADGWRTAMNTPPVMAVGTRVRHQNADFAFLVKPLPCESTTYTHFCGSFVVATA